MTKIYLLVMLNTTTKREVKMKKALSVLSVVLILCLAMTCISFATNAQKQENITYRSIKIVVDGVTVSPVDATGASTEPFILNSDGSTYLPVRAVAGALGLSVDWDEATSKVILKSNGSKVNGVTSPTATNKTVKANLYYRDITITLDGAKVSLVNAKGDAVEPFIYNNSTFIPLRAVASALNAEVSWDDGTSTVTIVTDTSTANPIDILTDPKDVTVAETDAAKATFSVAATDGKQPYTYQWQYSTDKGETWLDTNVSSSKTSELTIASIKAEMDGYFYRCVVTDNSGKTATSAAAKLTVEPKLYIKSQPADIETAQEGDLTYFKVEAAGGKGDYTYLWTQSADAGKTWTTCSDAYSTSAAAPTLIIKIDEKYDGHCYKCTVKDASGNEVTSNPAVYNYEELKYDLYINHSGILGTISYGKIIYEIAKYSEQNYSLIDITKMISSKSTIKLTGVPKAAAEEYIEKLEAARATVTKVVSGQAVDTTSDGDVVAAKTYALQVDTTAVSKLKSVALIPVLQLAGKMSISEATQFYNNGGGTIEGLTEEKAAAYLKLLQLAGATVQAVAE